MELAGLAALAFVAGVVSFTSPCMVPLLPGYVTFVSGLDDPAADRPGQVWLGASLFVAGFGLTFIGLGLTASTLGWFLAVNATVLNVASGILITTMGLVVLGVLRVPGLQRERRKDLGRMARGPGGAFPLGVAFAFGWTPCIGPVLAGILAAAAGRSSLAQGTFLLVVYTAGMAAPFLGVAAAVRRGAVRLHWLQRHGRAIEILGGVTLIVMGIAIGTGGWVAVMSRMLGWYARVGWPPI